MARRHANLNWHLSLAPYRPFRVNTDYGLYGVSKRGTFVTPMFCFPFETDRPCFRLRDLPYPAAIILVLICLFPLVQENAQPAVTAAEQTFPRREEATKGRRTARTGEPGRAGPSSMPFAPQLIVCIQGVVVEHGVIVGRLSVRGVFPVDRR